MTKWSASAGREAGSCMSAAPGLAVTVCSVGLRFREPSATSISSGRIATSSLPSQSATRVRCSPAIASWCCAATACGTCCPMKKPSKSSPTSWTVTRPPPRLHPPSRSWSTPPHPTPTRTSRTTQPPPAHREEIAPRRPPTTPTRVSPQRLPLLQRPTEAAAAAAAAAPWALHRRPPLRPSPPRQQRRRGRASWRGVCSETRDGP
mmetsp:Transcript_41503/g.103598  ORF Transcript_41503/g.103598 Transcript_41503/m.103598 type:complete len:205 (+) Transcript_41503:136-750(+)